MTANMSLEEARELKDLLAQVQQQMGNFGLNEANIEEAAKYLDTLSEIKRLEADLNEDDIEEAEKHLGTLSEIKRLEVEVDLSGDAIEEAAKHLDTLFEIERVTG